MECFCAENRVEIFRAAHFLAPDYACLAMTLFSVQIQLRTRVHSSPSSGSIINFLKSGKPDLGANFAPDLDSSNFQFSENEFHDGLAIISLF